VSRWTFVAGLLVIGAAVFLTSFDAVSAVAASRGAVNPRLSFTIPLAIDGLMVVGSAIAWAEAEAGRGRWFPRIVVGLTAALSVWANVSHAGSSDLLTQVLAGVPPVSLLAAVELGAWHGVIRRGTLIKPKAPEEISNKPAPGLDSEPRITRRIDIPALETSKRPPALPAVNGNGHRGGAVEETHRFAVTAIAAGEAEDLNDPTLVRLVEAEFGVKERAAQKRLAAVRATYADIGEEHGTDDN
jgi:hypothetical protein